MRHVVIAGLMGIGKTTASTAVAKALSLQHRDSDDDLHRLLGRTGKEIAAALGVEELHRLEAAVLLGALASPDALVVASAASTIEDPMCRAAMGRTAVTVVLEAPLGVLVDRSTAGSHRRHIDRTELEELADRRDPLFHEVADIVVSADQPRPDIVTQIVDYLGQFN
ncbi:MAG: shikimate kinase [Acidimicrobiia bacterium]|nr:shikimate kinase [Acidimicrobiia bacterium]